MPRPDPSALLSKRASRVLVVAALLLSIAIPVVSVMMITEYGTDEDLQVRIDSLRATQAPKPDPIQSLAPLPSPILATPPADTTGGPMP